MKRCFIVLLALSFQAGCRTTNDGSETKNIPNSNSNSNSNSQNETEDTGAFKFKEFEVRFTNPTCKTYAYDPNQNVVSVGGQPLTQKPKDTFCTYDDADASGSRPESPQYKLIEWIKDPATKEIFFAYLSFSNKTIENEICNAVTQRNVKVTFVLDNGTDLSQANKLLSCAPGNGDPAFAPKLLKRGHTGGIGYAHNKIFFINPNADDMRIVVSSGNMSSGIVLHHENWLFIQPEPKTYFAEAHRCLMKGQLDHYSSKSEYQNFIKTCKSQIPYDEETDVKTFFVPGEGNRATDFIEKAVDQAQSIKLAAHRFGYSKLINALKKELSSTNPASLELVFDDDTYWAGHGTPTGDNQPWEYTNAMSLVSKGAKVKWMETNHASHLLHHNKYLIFNMPQGSSQKSAVFTGAGNLTGTAFTSNFENFYYIETPKIVEAYNKQYDHVWNDLATEPNMMPSKNILPPGI